MEVSDELQYESCKMDNAGDRSVKSNNSNMDSIVVSNEESNGSNIESNGSNVESNGSNVESNGSNEESNRSNVESNCSSTCQICGMIFNSKNSMGSDYKLKSHLKFYHKKKNVYTCDDCGIPLNSRNELKVHDLSFHLEIVKNFQCNLCNEAFITEKNLKYHAQNVHEIVKYPCHICDKKFSENWSLTQHIRVVHQGPKTHKCDICDKSFQYSRNLREHKENVHRKTENEDKTTEITESNIEKSIDEIIAESAKIAKNETEENLEVIEEITPKTIKWKFPCHLCNKQFSDKLYLNRHIKIVHEAYVKEHKCVPCRKNFISENMFKEHIQNVHEKEKDKNCEIIEIKDDENEMIEIKGAKSELVQVKDVEIEIIDL